MARPRDEDDINTTPKLSFCRRYQYRTCIWVQTANPNTITEEFMYPTGNWKKIVLLILKGGRQIVTNYPMTYLAKRTC